MVVWQMLHVQFIDHVEVFTWGKEPEHKAQPETLMINMSPQRLPYISVIPFALYITENASDFIRGIADC